jgi:hypothetical protein
MLEGLFAIVLARCSPFFAVTFAKPRFGLADGVGVWMLGPPFEKTDGWE